MLCVPIDKLRNGASSTRLAIPAIATTGSKATARITARIKFTGLTPGNSYAWSWRHRAEGGGVTVHTLYGGIYGPALMEVWRA